MTTGEPAPAAEAQHAGTRRARVSWALFDWAQQPYNMLVLGFLFGPWFINGFVGDPDRGQALLAGAVAVAGFLIALLSPLLGADIDAGRSAKRWLLILTVPFVAGCLGLWFAAPGARELIPLILLCYVVATVATELSFTAVNSMLPYVAGPQHLGRLSSSAWALGYFAALASIGIVLTVFAVPDPPFGLDPARGEDDRIAGPFAAAWFLVFALPLFLFVPRAPRPKAGGRPFADLKATLKGLPRNRVMLRFLLGRMLVGDGVNAAGTFGPLIAAGLFRWETRETGIFGLLLALAAGLGSLAAGRLDDRIGSKRTTLLCVAGLAIGFGGAGTVGANQLFFFLPVEPPTPGDGLFASAAERLYVAFGVLIGFTFGPTGATLRTWMARLAPPGEEGRWFGLYALSGRATAFAAPALIGLLTAAVGDQRVAAPVVIGFLLAGALLLAGVPNQRERT